MTTARFRAYALLLLLCGGLCALLAASGGPWEPQAVAAMAEPAPPPAPQPAFYIPRIPLSRQLQAYTYALCEEQGVDYELILAVMWNESRFHTDAVHENRNGTRDSGIMQINDVNSQWLSEELAVTDLMDEEENILAGVTIVAGFIKKYGEHDGLMAYNLGETGMKRAKGRGVATTETVQRVLSKRAEYERLEKLK